MILYIIPLLLIMLIFITGLTIKDKNPKVKIVLENEKTITLELYRDVAPKSVENFLKLVDENFYDGVIFHRIIKNFMVQAGGFTLDGNQIIQKEQTNTITGEFTNNGYRNDLKHELGIISMARTNDPNSASSQFFICTATSHHLDGNYAAFGKTVDEESNKVLLELNEATTTRIDYLADFPVPVIKIKTIHRL